MANSSTKPKVLVLRAPGTNCDQETAHAWRLAGAEPEVFHFHRLLDNASLLGDYQVLTFPGGFSYGDDLGAGRVWSARIHLKLADTLREFVEKGGLVLGICNGFQVLVASGLLPAGARKDMTPTASLSYNISGQYEARWVDLKATPGNCVFLRGIERISMPSAHGEGRFLTATTAELDSLEANGQVVLKYVDSVSGQPTEAYPANPNGSPRGVAGVCDPTGRVLGLMPHPERFVSPLHHPNWTRFPKDAPPTADGLKLFTNAVEALA
jgi:phosphoribosylformylglycinamidine synthase